MSTETTRWESGERLPSCTRTPEGGGQSLTPPSRLSDSAEETAKKHEITREDQDNFCLESYRKAAEAWKAGAFKNEIAPVTIPNARTGDVVITEDEEYKKVKTDKVPSLKPVFKKDGTITAANASTLNDGASALVLASQDKVNELGLQPLAKVICTYPVPVAPWQAADPTRLTKSAPE